MKPSNDFDKWLKSLPIDKLRKIHADFITSYTARGRPRLRIDRELPIKNGRTSREVLERDLTLMSRGFSLTIDDFKIGNKDAT